MKNIQTKTQTLFADYPEIISVSQLMKLLQIGKVLAYKLIEDKKIKAIKIGRDYKIVRDSVIEFINNGD